MDVLFRTPHGSRLYGLAHADSDEDWYTVIWKGRTKRKHYSKHSIVDGVDSTVVDFPTWLTYCMAGVPQALEAMFSQQATVDEIAPFRSDFYTFPSAEVSDRYFSTIRKFALNNDNSFKHKRHALRLALNFSDIRRYGRFNPTLTTKQVLVLNNLAKADAEHVYEIAKKLAWSLD